MSKIITKTVHRTIGSVAKNRIQSVMFSMTLQGPTTMKVIEYEKIHTITNPVELEVQCSILLQEELRAISRNPNRLFKKTLGQIIHTVNRQLRWFNDKLKKHLLNDVTPPRNDMMHEPEIMYLGMVQRRDAYKNAIKAIWEMRIQSERRSSRRYVLY